jgi:outer membrane receptor protein involved in Fe transport
MADRDIRKTIASATLAAIAAGVQAVGGAAEEVNMGTITVRGEGMREADKAFSVNSISQEAINGKNSASPITIIEEAPGVSVTAYQQGGVADVFTLRGFTGGGHGSDVAVSLDGINLNEGESHADGYVDTNIIIPLELESATVYKGPVSPLYGNFARGGAIAFTTRKGGEYTDIDLSMGSYRTYNAQAAVGAKLGDVQLNGALQGYESEGWRANSRYTKMNQALRAAYQLDDRSEIALSLRGHGGHWQAPGYVLWDQFKDEDRRRLQDPIVAQQQDTGEKQFGSQRLDYDHLFGDNLKLLTYLYNTDHKFTRFQTTLNVANPAATVQREFNYKRSVQAGGGSLNGRSQIAGLDSNWVAGIDYYHEETNTHQWNDITHVRQLEVAQDKFINDTLTFYGQMDLDVDPRFRPSLGVRYDDFGGKRTNELTGVKNDQNDYSHISPKLGVRSAITDTWELRASAANGFALANGVQAFDPNIDVDPTDFWQYEVGINGHPSQQVLLDLSAFILNSSNEIQEDPPGSGQFENAGATRRRGVEGEVRYFPAAVSHLEFGVTFGFYDSEIRKNANPALVGNEISGLAKHVANFDVAYSPPEGLGGSLRLRSIGKWFANAANTVTYDGHDVLSGSVFYNFAMADGKKARLYLDLNNLTNEVYTENASGGPHPTQGAVPTSTSPMPPLNFMAGVMVSM